MTNEKKKKEREKGREKQRYGIIIGIAGDGRESRIISPMANLSHGYRVEGRKKKTLIEAHLLTLCFDNYLSFEIFLHWHWYVTCSQRIKFAAHILSRALFNKKKLE